MRWLVSNSLRLRILVVVLMIIVLIVGIQIVRNIPLDVFPEFAPPLVEIQTEVPGLSTTEVEALVTVPIEYAMNGTPWLQTIRSKSVLGLSSVVLLFEDGTDLMQARQLVQERLSRVSCPFMSVVIRMPPLCRASVGVTCGVRGRRFRSDSDTDARMGTGVAGGGVPLTRSAVEWDRAATERGILSLGASF